MMRMRVLSNALLRYTTVIKIHVIKIRYSINSKKLKASNEQSRLYLTGRIHMILKELRRLVKI